MPPTPLAIERLRAALRTPTVQIALILGAALLLRLAWVLCTRWEPMFDDDAYRYDFTARALADGLGYVHLDGRPTAFWPPGYSLILAALYIVFGQHVLAGQLLNVLVGTATVGIVYLLARRFAGHMTALVAAAIVALWPSLIFFTGVTLSETVFTFLILLCLYILVVAIGHEQPGSAHSTGRSALLGLLAGLVLGFAALTRGQALLLPLVLVPFWLVSGLRWPAIALMMVVVIAGAAVIVLPWTVRNTVELDQPVLISTNAGVDFWIGHNDGAGGDFGESGGDALVFSHPELDPVEREVRVNNEGFRKGLRYALTHPAEEVILPFRKLFWLYYNDEEGLKWNEGHGAQRFLPDGFRPVLSALSNVYYFTVLALLALGVRRWFSLREPAKVLLLSLVLYWTLIHLAFFGDPRFHAPILPVMALLVAIAWFPSKQVQTVTDVN